MEQFVLFFTKIEQIFEVESPFWIAGRAIFKIIRILFRYADNTCQLCIVKFEGYEKRCVSNYNDFSYSGICM